jgi:hypothetical protein
MNDPIPEEFDEIEQVEDEFSSQDLETIDAVDLEKIKPSNLGVLVKPYDVSKTKIDSDRLSLDAIIKRIINAEIDLFPDFQRAIVWNNDQMSRLIESILISIPLPAFYFDGTDDEKWLVVDGLQRLNTLRLFVAEKTTSQLILSGLEYLHQYNGCRYDDLPRKMQRRIEETQVTIHIIRPGTSEEVKYNIFRRINTGGVALTAQEIRHALNPGKVVKFLKDLSRGDNSFSRAVSGSIKTRRMLDCEFALSFCAFILVDFKDYLEENMDKFLTQAMIRLNEISDQERDDLKVKFRHSMELAYQIFGEKAFRRESDSNKFDLNFEHTNLYNKNRAPINKALFEAWSVNLAKLTLEDSVRLIIKKEDIKRENLESLKDPLFILSITQGTGGIFQVRVRFSMIQSVIHHVLEDSTKPKEVVSD